MVIIEIKHLCIHVMLQTRITVTRWSHLVCRTNRISIGPYCQFPRKRQNILLSSLDEEQRPDKWKHRWSYEWYFLPCNNQNTTPYYVQTSANFSLRRWSIVYNLAFVINIAYTVHSTINNNHSSKQTHVHFLCLLSVTPGAILSLLTI